MAEASTPDISVVVPTYRRPDLLGRCLASLAAQDLPAARYEVVVVDDCSGPETEAVLEEAARRSARLRWVSQPVNRGPAAARNLGVTLASGRLVLFVDDDIVAPPDLLGRHLLRHGGGDDRLGVVGLVEWHPDLTVTPFMEWLDAADVQFAYARMTEGPVVPPSKAFYTCNVSLSRSLFAEAGGFDERFPYPAYEDTELALRLARLGFRLEYRPSCLAWHARAVDLPTFRRRMEQVGEAAVILNRVQPELTADLDLEGPQARGWRRVAYPALLLLARAVPSRRIRARYYQAAVNRSFCKGVGRGRGRVAQASSTLM